MELLRRCQRDPESLAILPGAFHPITRAHLALAETALSRAGEVLFVMPRRLPHKGYDSVGLEERLSIVRTAIEPYPRFSLGVSEGGLFDEIAGECREHFDPSCRLWIVCGRDAAERAMSWAYPEGRTAASLLERCGLLVADRSGRFDPPPTYADRIVRLEMPSGWEALSATEIRRRIESGEPWRHLVPESAADEIARVYLRR